MRLNLESIGSNADKWRESGFILPEYDINKMRTETAVAPEWLHIGPGNIFRGYIARLADELIAKGDMKTGIIAADCFSTEPIERSFTPFDNLVLLVGLGEGGCLRVIGSIADAQAAVNEGFEKLKAYARRDSLKMISFTITEKGYKYTDISGNIIDSAAKDIKSSPEGELSTAMGKTAALLYERFKAGAAPIALVSMDNCSGNGDKLREGVLFIVNGWAEKGSVPKEFVEYVSDASKVSFPWSMIDKITPRPDQKIAERLAGMGIEGMECTVTKRGTFTAPFVNAEMPEYLVIEDDFPNGRPPLEKAGVYLTDRETVNKTERMKVMTCLNPLHTALAVFGCLLGYEKIADEMNDAGLKGLVYKLGYGEGLKVVTDPKIIRPEAFLEEVLTKRLPNADLPDTPQRIATDTSQKIPIRFGETIKAYAERGELDELDIIPMILAGWLRYLMGKDDTGNDMPLSADPQLEYLCGKLSVISLDKPLDDAGKAAVCEILSNETLFGFDLVKLGLSDKILSYFEKMLKIDGVRKLIDTLA